MALRLRDLAYLYHTHGAYGAELWESLFADAPLRITLSELPQVTGASTLWKQEIEDKLRAFQTQNGWMLDPLLIPVALEVVIKPPPSSRQHGLHDLDNILRDYLIPRVVEILNPVSHYAFAFHTLEKRREEGQPTPPVSSRAGVTRYEAWRLPPATEGAKGFVSVAIVADMTGYADTFGRIDKQIENWRNSLE